MNDHSRHPPIATPTPPSPYSQDAASGDNVFRHSASLTRDQRAACLSSHGVSRGATLWLTGLSGAGKSTIACALELALVSRGIHAYRLDGDNLRHGINRDLGFAPEHRTENIRRVAEIARLFADSGAIAIVCAISPFRADRDSARALHQHDKEGLLSFFEVFVDTPLSTCEQRDPKGLYRKARSGQLTGMTGVDSPYEPPVTPELVLQAHARSVEDSVAACLSLLSSCGILAPKVEQPASQR